MMSKTFSRPIGFAPANPEARREQSSLELKDTQKKKRVLKMITEEEEGGSGRLG